MSETAAFAAADINRRSDRQWLLCSSVRRKKLIIFVKAPRVGLVKSRLAASLGSDGAAAAYRTLVETLLANLTASRSEIPTIPHSALRTPHTIELRFTPDDAFAEIQSWLAPTWGASPQGPGNLGERMQRAFVQAFAAGAERVVLIGSDCPTVTTDDIERAWQALATHDLVLGPATDGGYWLIGLAGARTALFEKIRWSTETVLQETLKRAANLRLRVHLLSQRTDIDTEKEWQEFRRAQPGG